MNPGEKIKQWSERAKTFYTEVRSEMRKVSWPSRQEVFSTTLIVIGAVVFFGFYLGVVDAVLGVGISKIMSYFHVS
jgi:preprotein translocase subunit SecE